MKTNYTFFGIKIVCLLFFLTILSCSSDNEDTDGTADVQTTLDNGDDDDVEVTVNYANIDFSNWKVTLPVDENENGSPDEYQPSELMDYGYQTLAPVQPYMYDDASDSSLVFYTFPDISTINSTYSRTELRELINPSNSRDNWSLETGGVMQGRLKVESISEDTESSNDFHRVIIMQIHGIISQEDMDTFGFDSNNGPPLLKIYWKDGYIWSHKKSLIDETTSGDDLLDTSSDTWTDVKRNLGYVGYDAFDFKIIASTARLEVQLNDNAPFVYEDVSLNKWPYENYFKAGNYLITTHPDAFSYVKYYNLAITH